MQERCINKSFRKRTKLMKKCSNFHNSSLRIIVWNTARRLQERRFTCRTRVAKSHLNSFLSKEMLQLMLVSLWNKIKMVKIYSLKFRDLENQLYSEDNNKVENRDFLGLEQALDHTTGRKVPDHLKLIEFRIENDRGKAAGSAHFSVLVLVCAAIKEMEESDEFSDWETLKKWAATLNQAKELGFRVGFADKLLKMKLLAYFATQLLKASQKKKGLAFS
ncbi:uncharacterized protein LOC120116385 isoform X2 [Hibiscus syriacus]|uniref:uncharacterized protein LOC120116385 isoform X2 n=1 Tax=Hibiscus syriacus TaxID=106335 RepID=UPI00192221CA|nr:uncharacterized protein LOC120116385 isoform X2 [Hibiscus syriacus]